MNTKRHPLFNPHSKYGRLRSSLIVEEKIRGYFYWLAACADRQQAEAQASRSPGTVPSLPANTAADGAGLPMACRSLIFLVRTESLSSMAMIPTSQPPTCIAWHGGRVVWGTSGGEVAMADPRQPNSLQSLYRHQGAVLSLAVGADGAIVSGAADGTVAFWNAGTAETSTMNEHAAPVAAVAMLADGRCLSVSSDGRAKLWDPRTGWVLTTEVRSADNPEQLSGTELKVVVQAEPTPIEVPGTGPTMLAMAHKHSKMQWMPAQQPGSLPEPMLLWNAASCQARTVCLGAETLAADLLPDGRIVAGGADQQVAVRHAPSQRVEHSYRFEAPVVAIAVSVSGCIACGTADGRIHLLHLAGVEAVDSRAACAAFDMLPQAVRFRAENLPPGANCRLMILDAKMLTHLRQSVPPLMSISDDAHLVAKALDARVLERDIKAARILSAVPDADGKVGDDGRVQITAGVPKNSPPLAADCFVVLAVEQPGPNPREPRQAVAEEATR